MGALIPEALHAADRLDAMGFGTELVCLTSPGLLFDSVQARRGNSKAPTWILD